MLIGNPYFGLVIHNAVAVQHCLHLRFHVRLLFVGVQFKVEFIDFLVDPSVRSEIV